jgi:mono/diheme cytochrome c family protein
MLRIALIAALLGASGGHGAAESSDRVVQGHALVKKLCAGCHAIGKRDASPHAAAPPLRNLDRHLELDALADRLRSGLLSNHPDMPMFRFSREDAWSASAYIRSIQQ